MRSGCQARVSEPSGSRHRAADVLVDDRGAHVRHLAALGEPVDDEGVQRVGVGHGDVQQEVVATRDDEDADGLGQVGQQTNDYDDVRAYVARTATADLEYLGLALHGSRRAVSRVTGTLRLLGRSSPSASPAA